MRTTRCLTGVTVVGLFASHGTVQAQQPLNTAFNYQGRLKESGSPVDGTADFSFSLWDAETGGNFVGFALQFTDVTVVDGLFTVELNFGIDVFKDEARWLEIQARHPAGNPNTFVTLSPRQPITPTPFALQTRGMVSDPNGNIGIGNNAPQDRLHVTASPFGDDAALRLQDDLDPTSHTLIRDADPVFAQFQKVNDSGIPIIQIDPIPLDGVSPAFVQFFRNTNTIGSKRVSFLRGDDTTASSAVIGVDGTDSYFQVHGGNLGVGTAAPLSKLHIDSGELRFTGPQGVGVETLLVSGGNPASGTPTEDGFRLRSEEHFFATNEEALVIEKTDGNQTDPDGGIAFTNTGSDGVEDTALVIRGGGNVGIGTEDPSFPLSLGSSLSHTKLALFETGPTNSFGMGVVSGQFSFHLNGSGARYAFYDSDDLTNEILTIKGSGNVGIGTSTPVAKLHVEGTTRTNVIEITGADLAEKFPTSEVVEPGMVVAIDPDNPGQLCLARGAYNRRVAGIVSGANDFSVGAVLGNLPGHEDAPPIALSGRVWVHCDASTGPINPGDLLTTSSTTGHAMKVADHTRASCAIIGKAMTSLDSGCGLVLVLVSLQ